MSATGSIPASSTPEKIPVTWQDFRPVNRWTVDEQGERYKRLIGGKETVTYTYIYSEKTKDGYWERTENSNNSRQYEELGPIYLIDQATNNRYWNESKKLIRFKCFLLTLGTPLVHSIGSVVNIAYRILKLVTFSHFWVNINSKDEKKYNFKARAKNAGADLLRIVTTPISIVGLELSAIFGLVSPLNGRKLYASFERAQYGNFILAPCFQPDPQKHALGGDPNKPDQI